MVSGVSQVFTGFLKPAQCILCLEEGQLCLCVCLVEAKRPQQQCHGARSCPALIYLILLQWGGGVNPGAVNPSIEL